MGNKVYIDKSDIDNLGFNFDDFQFEKNSPISKETPNIESNKYKNLNYDESEYLF